MGLCGMGFEEPGLVVPPGLRLTDKLLRVETITGTYIVAMKNKLNQWKKILNLILKIVWQQFLKHRTNSKVTFVYKRFVQK